MAKNGVVRGKSWTSQTLSDAWDATNLDGLCGAPWQGVALELQLTKKVTAHISGAEPPLLRIAVEGKFQRLSQEDLKCCRQTSRLHGHTGGRPGCAALALHARAIKPHSNEC